MTKVNKVINAATATHALPYDVEAKAKEKPKQKPEESIRAELLAAVETMQAEIVQLREIVNQHANGKSGGARPRFSFGNNRGIMHRKGCTSCIAHNHIGNCHHCYKCVNCPKVYSAPESENMKAGVAAANTSLSHHCGYCGKKEKLKKLRQCSGCKSTIYCSEKCQRHTNHYVTVFRTFLSVKRWG